MKLILSKILIALIVFSWFFPLFPSQALIGKPKENYPKLVNIYLKWILKDSEVDELSKWDVLVLDIQTQENSAEIIKAIRRKNPSIIILPRIATEEINTGREDLWKARASVRNDLLDALDNCWYLTDKSNNRLSFWPGTALLNITDGACQSSGKHWHDFLPEFLSRRVLSSGLWDGIFYDNVWPTISWFNSGNLDINRNGQILAKSEIDKKWAAGEVELLKRTREVFGSNYLIIANSHAYDGFHPYINGMLFENFPASWESNGIWSGSMNSYLRDKGYNQPKVMMINTNANNTWGQENYRKLRFSLGSSLLGEGYFSYDFGDQNHGQTWWYDEYAVNLGKPLGGAKNITDKSSSVFKAGVWRRDFENGIVVINSTKENKNYVFSGEQFEKIKGGQDPRINNGAKINMVSLMGEDGVVLLNTAGSVSNVVKEVVEGASFFNGAFVRVFNKEGRQVRNGFFSYRDDLPAGSIILTTDIDGDGVKEDIVSKSGTIYLYKKGKVYNSFSPYDGVFRGNIYLTVADVNGDGNKEIITGPGPGGGPHVRVFNRDGRLLGGFFAYGKNFRGGVAVAAGDLNSDGAVEIIVGTGPGGGPHVRVFSGQGKLLSAGFFAYDASLRGGVSIASGQIDLGGGKEIITGSGAGSTPEVRVYNGSGRLLHKFLAFDADDKSGIDVMAVDIDNDGTDEILAASRGF